MNFMHAALRKTNPRKRIHVEKWTTNACLGCLKIFSLLDRVLW